MNRITSALLACLAACASAPLEPTQPGAAHRADAAPVPSRFTLPNGITVVLQENHSSPVVAMQAWVRAGSVYEQPGEEGAAHLQEHLLLRGTKARPNAALRDSIEGLGGALQAHAGYDFTIIELVLSSRDAETGAAVLADVLGASAFDPNDVSADIAATRNELRAQVRDPAWRLARSLFESVYAGHPYARPLAGTDEQLAKLDRAKLVAFYERQFVTNNIMIVISGDLSTTQAQALAARAFGDFPRGGSQSPEPGPAPAWSGHKISVDELGTTTDVVLAFAWPLPSLAHRDTYALELLSIVMAQGASARINERLVREQALAKDVYGFSHTPRGPGLWALGVAASTDKAQAAALAVLTEIDRARTDVVRESELRRAKALVLSDTYHHKQTMEGQAAKAGFFNAALGDPSHDERYSAEIERVTITDLKRVAQTYLRGDGLALSAVVPVGKRDVLRDQELIARAVELEEAVKRRNKVVLPAAGALGVHRVKLASGAIVLLQPDHSLPIVAVRAAFVGGLRAEEKATNGTHAVLARLLPLATEKRSRRELGELKESLAASIDGFTTQNSFGLQGEFLKSTTADALELFAELLSNAKFSQEDVERERAILLAQVRSREDNPSGLAFDLFAEHLFQAHPYRLRPKGSVETLSALRASELQAFYKRRYTRDKLVLSVVGDFEPEVLLAQLNRLFGAPLAAGNEAAPEAPVATDPALTAPVVVERGKLGTAGQIVLGFRGATIGDKDRYALELLSVIMNGESGRLQSALRPLLGGTRPGNTPSVAAVSIEGLEPGYFATYVHAAADKVDAAVAALKAELKRMGEAPVSNDELERARRYLLGSHAIAAQSPSARAASLALNELYGLGFDDDATFDAQVSAITAQDLTRVAKDYLDLERSVLVLIRPQAPASQPQQ